MTNGQTMHTLPGPSQFPTTRWSLVVAALSGAGIAQRIGNLLLGVFTPVLARMNDFSTPCRSPVISRRPSQCGRNASAPAISLAHLRASLRQACFGQ
jgi:hypothetical protein